MSRQTSPINYGISRARGYTRPGYSCFDCGRTTKSVMEVRRDMYGDGLDDIGSLPTTLVCRNGSGCHKDTDGYDIPPYVAPQN